MASAATSAPADSATGLQSATKKARSAYEIVYHTGFLGRAHPLLLMLEDANTAYKRVHRKDVDRDPKVFAWPWLRIDGKRVLSQTPVLCAFLGKELGSVPPPELEFEGLKLALDIADVWSEAYGHRKKIKTAAEADEYMSPDGRLARLLAVIEACAVSDEYGEANGDYVFGSKCTYVDFWLAHSVAFLRFCYGDARTDELLKVKAKTVLDISERVFARPRVKAFVDSDRHEPILYSSVAATSLT